MSMKLLSHAGFAGLFLVAFAPAAFAETEQLQTQQQQQIQQQQREQIQSREHMPSDQGLQQREQTRTMTEEQERLPKQNNFRYSSHSSSASKFRVASTCPLIKDYNNANRPAP